MISLTIRLVAVLFLALGLLTPAFAHTADISTGKIVEAKERVYRLDLGFLATDVERMFSETMAERKGVDLSPPGVLEAEIGRFVERRVSMQNAHGNACASRINYSGEDQTNADSALIVIDYDCADVTGQIFYDASKLLETQGKRGKHLVTLTGVNAGETMLYPGDPPLDLSKPLETVWQLMGKFLSAGVEHILTGYDHIAFLLAILLWATRVWPVVKIVTAFTISHSVTLSLAALNIVTLPSAITEALIAASIIYVAAENFFSRRVDGRWRDTFLFGFIHGFGFASGLLELGVPERAVIPALAAFNIGVELGQLGVVLVFVPLLLFGVDKMTGGARSPRLVQGGSAVIALLGAYWLLDRVGALAFTEGLSPTGPVALAAVAALLLAGAAYYAVARRPQWLARVFAGPRRSIDPARREMRRDTAETPPAAKKLIEPARSERKSRPPGREAEASQDAGQDIALLEPEERAGKPAPARTDGPRRTKRNKKKK